MILKKKNKSNEIKKDRETFNEYVFWRKYGLGIYINQFRIVKSFYHTTTETNNIQSSMYHLIKEGFLKLSYLISILEELISIRTTKIKNLA